MPYFAAMPSDYCLVAFENEVTYLRHFLYRCGKTHTAVNFAAVALSRQQTTLVTSNNPRALIAFEEKLTPPLRKICLNVASCVEGGMTELHKMLEGLQIDLSRVKEEAKTYKENIKVR